MKERPLSPHLQIYKPLFTMMMSIFHRLTGVALYVGVISLVAYFIALASGKEAYGYFKAFDLSLIGTLINIGFLWALFHHMLGGIRHFIWDTGNGFGVEQREWLAKLTLLGSLALTALVVALKIWG
jgi:succinate dehydrogenase / fumarate reductase, cytochrome b subunit